MFAGCWQLIWVHLRILWVRDPRYSQLIWAENRDVCGSEPGCLRAATVIQTALDQGIPLVCIDEAAGRRIARICGLQVTGSIGILLKAKQQGYPVPVREALDNMQRQGIWLSRRLMTFALQESGESP